jgi:p-hydroxybenzoate 3-monooxygenase
VSGPLRTQVAIIGAGPAGLFLAHLLRRANIDAVVLETRDREHVQQRVRAGVLEQSTADLMDALGIGARLRRDGLVHAGVNIAVGDDLFRIDLKAPTGGGTVTVYGQQEVMKDLYGAADERGLRMIFEAGDARLHDFEGAHPFVTYTHDGAARRLDCDFIAGCDGFHGISRKSIPSSALKIEERNYPFGWLGILADVPPVGSELIYASHSNGFALASMRSPARSRYYLQCDLGDELAAWPDERFWDELCRRLGPAGEQVTRAPSIEKGIAAVRSFLAEPMRHGRLFLAGDAAHILPPIGAKGMNLAVSDVLVLSQVLEEFCRNGSDSILNSYGVRALPRVRRAESFSRSFLEMTHRFEDSGPDRKAQLAQLRDLQTSVTAQAAFAQNYVGSPLN